MLLLYVIKLVAANSSPGWMPFESEVRLSPQKPLEAGVENAEKRKNRKEISLRYCPVVGGGEPLTDEQILIGKCRRFNPLNKEISVCFGAADSADEYSISQNLTTTRLYSMFFCK